MSIKQNYFDREPSDAITAERVRSVKPDEEQHSAVSFKVFYEYVLARLLHHPGVSSSARAVIEAALK